MQKLNLLASSLLTRVHFVGSSSLEGKLADKFEFAGVEVSIMGLEAIAVDRMAVVVMADSYFIVVLHTTLEVEDSHSRVELRKLMVTAVFKAEADRVSNDNLDCKGLAAF